MNHPNLLCSFCHTLTLLGLCVWLDIIVALLMIRLSRIFYPTTRKNSTATLLGPKNRILCSSVSLVMDLSDGGSKKKQDFLAKMNSLQGTHCILWIKLIVIFIFLKQVYWSILIVWKYAMVSTMVKDGLNLIQIPN